MGGENKRNTTATKPKKEKERGAYMKLRKVKKNERNEVVEDK